MSMTSRAPTPRFDELIARAAAGDGRAQSQVLQGFWPVIRATVRSRLSEGVRAIGAEDITQEAALRVLRRLPTFRGEGSSAFAAWVKAIAESVIVDALRRERASKRGRRSTGPLTAEPAAPQWSSEESKVHARRRWAELRAELARLEEEARAPLALQQLGYSYLEIADALGCSPEAARKRVARASEKLRTALSGFSSEYV